MKHIRLILVCICGLVLTLLYNNCSGNGKINTESNSENLSVSTCRLIKQEAPINPQTIAQAVQLLNQIEKPVSISCFLSFLPKPLKVYSVDNAANAQPSAGQRSPRIFLFNHNMIISVVPDGPGKDVIEMAEVTGIFRSVKAEIPFPVLGEILPEEPFLRILSVGGTACRSCHANEIQDFSISSAEAYTSDMIFPNPVKKVEQPVLLNYARKCDFSAEPFRCEMLKTIFIDGEALDSPFLAAPISKFE